MEHYNSRKVAEKYHMIFTKDAGNLPLKIKATKRYKKFISGLMPGAHILDAGCGTGRFVHYFIRDGFKVTGIDLSASMIEIAAKNNPEASFRVMDMCNLDFPDHTFDGIWNVAAVLHLNEFDVLKSFLESERVLKKGGRLYVATRTGDVTCTSVEEATEGGSMTVHYYSPEKLMELLASAGFDTLDMSIEQDDYSRPFNYIHIYAES
ncbi:MAG: class I SAM-dependent methyltransferase [Thermoplasmata archaeon]